jgi:hypothetical protein
VTQSPTITSSWGPGIDQELTTHGLDFADHYDQVVPAVPASATQICTSWMAASGRQEVCTTKLAGETHGEWLRRHRAAVLAAMVNEPPT